jgi:hypothetical protein
VTFAANPRIAGTVRATLHRPDGPSGGQVASLRNEANKSFVINGRDILFCDDFFGMNREPDTGA